MPINNSSFQKNSNISLIARTIWKHKEISRVNLARELKLYRSTVTNITSFLLEKNVIREGKPLSSGKKGGRRAITLSLNNDFGCVFGFDIQPSHARMTVLALDGTPLWSCTERIREERSLIELIEKAVETTLQKQKEIGIPLIGMAFSIPGIVDSEKGEVIYSWPFKCRNLKVKEIIEEKFGYPVSIENDANAAGWYAINSGVLTPEDTALTIVGDYHQENENVAVGVGFATIINETVYRGYHSAAGEFVSLSWKPGMDEQSGLDCEILRTPQDNPASWNAWMEDTFRSIVPLVMIMDFSKVLLYGEPFKDREAVMNFFTERCPSFKAVMEKTGCTLKILSDIENASAVGAGLMSLQNLFTVPSIESQDAQFASHWDDIIALSEKQSQGKRR